MLRLKPQPIGQAMTYNNRRRRHLERQAALQKALVLSKFGSLEGSFQQEVGLSQEHWGGVLVYATTKQVTECNNVAGSSMQSVVDIKTHYLDRDRARAQVSSTISLCSPLTYRSCNSSPLLPNSFGPETPLIDAVTSTATPKPLNRGTNRRSNLWIRAVITRVERMKGWPRWKKGQVWSQERLRAADKLATPGEPAV